MKRNQIKKKKFHDIHPKFQNIENKNTEKIKVHKKMVVLSSLFIVFVFFLVLSTSYAFFTTTVKGKEFVIYTGNLAVNYEKKTDVIDVENLYPMTNTEGLNQTPHEFSVTNSGNISARYQIRLELDDTIKDMVPLEYIKLAYSMDGSSYSSPILLSNLNSSLVILRNMILEPDTSNTFGIKLWIDLSAPNEIQGKTFKARIVVDSIQNVEDGYVVNTVPIITLNKDSNGNYDIHLQVNDTYTELGVEKVEDDNEILLPSQVVKTYEYYDGTTLTTVDSVDTSKVGIYYITYSIMDSSNHVGKAVRIVTVNPTNSIPSITLNGESSITLGETDYYKEEGVTVSDNNQVTTIGEVKTSTIGTYIVRYIVVDSNGNLNSVIRTVSVINPYIETILNGTDPVLTSNLVPIQIAEDGTVTKASTASTWYSYEAKSWANAVILKDDTVSYANGETIPEDNIESYFVWIPRYKYKIFNEGQYTEATSVDSAPTTSAAQEINIIFESKDVIPSSGTTVGSYLTHPAFTSFDTNGIWVGKFETSGSTSNIDILPNVPSLRNLNIKTMFELSYNYDRTLDSHMMKNTEWGAVAYLSHSKYGINKEIRINNSSTYTTGCAATTPALNYVGKSQTDHSEGYFEGCENEYNTEIGVLASTTGNITGIYDMSGGAWEYMASLVDGVYGNSGFDSKSITQYDSQYFDIYSSDSTVTSYNNRILGDATGELGPFYYYLDSDGYYRFHNHWYNDSAYFIESSYSWFGRGGNYYLGMVAGSLKFERRSGSADDYLTFRVVLAP